MSLSELPTFAPISDHDARLACKEVTRRLAIVAVVVLVLGGVESGDMDSSTVPRDGSDCWRVSVQRIDDDALVRL